MAIEARIVGIMAGSSRDGVDVVMAHFEDETPNIEAATTLPYPTVWLDRLEEAPTLAFPDLLKLHVDYAHWLGVRLRQWLLTQEMNGLEAPEAWALHGHTVLHAPDKGISWQLGCGQTLVSNADVPVITDFRVQDIAEGGQGAPLVPAAEWALFPEYELFLNLGGIANLSVLPRKSSTQHFLQATEWKTRHATVLGFDVCVCNQLLNALARTYNTELKLDRDGELAATGTVNPALKADWQAGAYQHLPPPKSLGNDALPEVLWPIWERYEVQGCSTQDGLATAVSFVCAEIAGALQRLGIWGLPIFVTGGGAHNRFLLEQLQAALDLLAIQVVVPSAQWVDYKEAAAFAWLGRQVLVGQHTTLPAATGARRAVIGGAVHLPAAGNWHARHGKYGLS